MDGTINVSDKKAKKKRHHKHGKPEILDTCAELNIAGKYAAEIQKKHKKKRKEKASEKTEVSERKVVEHSITEKVDHSFSNQNNVDDPQMDRHKKKKKKKKHSQKHIDDSAGQNIPNDKKQKETRFEREVSCSVEDEGQNQELNVNHDGMTEVHYGDEMPDVYLKSRKKKKKRKKEIANCSVVDNHGRSEVDVTDAPALKQKKNKRHLEDDALGVSDEHRPKKKKKRKTQTDDTKNTKPEIVDLHEGIVIDHVKTKRDARSHSNESQTAADSGKSGKKRKHRNKTTLNDCEDNDLLCINLPNGKGKKHKKKKKDSEPLCFINHDAEKAMGEGVIDSMCAFSEKTPQEETKGETSSISYSAGHVDDSFEHFSISNTKSHKPPSSTNYKTVGYNYGQWDNATLGSADKQEKFLRLLGGFKSRGGSDVPSTQRKSFGLNFGKSKQNHASMALSTDQATDLNEKLEQQYLKAMNAKLSLGKGVGLGYTPPPEEGKKFYINKGVCRSKTFD